MAASQPHYTLQIDVQHCAYDVRVNDGPVLENARGFPVVTEIPVNRWLRNGSNAVSVRLLPLPGTAALDPGAKCTVVVYLREREAARDTRQEVARLEFPGEVTVPFTASVPFPLFRWFTSPEITPGDATLAELVRELENLHALLEAKDLSALLAAVHERDTEDAAASYQSVEEQAANSRIEYSQFFNEAEYTLRTLITRNLRLRLFGNGRLARVDLISNGESPLYYLTADRQTAGYIHFLFCKSATGKWMVIR